MTLLVVCRHGRRQRHFLAPAFSPKDRKPFNLEALTPSIICPGLIWLSAPLLVLDQIGLRHMHCEGIRMPYERMREELAQLI
jgi:hypothetical protein